MRDQYFENEKFCNLKLEGETIESHEFVDCDFNDCSFENLALIKCSFISCNFNKCRVVNLETDLSEMSFGSFTDCSLTGVNWALLLPGGRFMEPISRIASCRLKYNTFMNMNFKKFNFCGSEITRSMFAECKLSESLFKGCKLEDTEFFKCDLKKADFREATGYKIDISTNTLSGARFTHPDVIALLESLNIKIE